MRQVTTLSWTQPVPGCTGKVKCDSFLQDVIKNAAVGLLHKSDFCFCSKVNHLSGLVCAIKSFFLTNASFVLWHINYRAHSQAGCWASITDMCKKCVLTHANLVQRYPDHTVFYSAVKCSTWSHDSRLQAHSLHCCHSLECWWHLNLLKC